MGIQTIKKNIINLFPQKFHLPMRFYYSKMVGRLEPEIDYLPKLVSHRKRAIDIGASRAYYTYALSRLCDYVEAFEPQQWACDAIIAYGAPNVNCYNIGLSNLTGTMELNIPLINDETSDSFASFRYISGKKKTINVMVDKLDNYNFRDVCFIKIDVEGHESEVIEGAKNTIFTQKPILLVEIEQRHLFSRSIDDVFNQIIDLNYRGYFLYKNEKFDLSDFSYIANQQTYLEKVSLTGFCEEYINNFIFEPL
jgi:FkbM family methyltransferase